MKFLAILSAGLIAATVSLPAAAPAQERHERVVTRTVSTHTERRGGYNRHHTRRVCKWQWRNHHRTRVCRTVRY